MTTTQKGQAMTRRSNPTANLHAFTYRQTLPDGTPRQIRRSTRLYAYSVVGRWGRHLTADENRYYDPERHGAEGTWAVIGDHSTMALAQKRLADEVKFDHIDPAGEPKVWTPSHSERPRTDRTFTELRIIEFDNARPTCAVCGVPVAETTQQGAKVLVHDDNGATAHQHTAELAPDPEPEPDPPATAPVPEIDQRHPGLADVVDMPAALEPDEAELARRRGLVAEAARNTRARMEIEHGPVGDDVVEVHQAMTIDALDEALEAVEPGNWGDLTPSDLLVTVHAIVAERDEARVRAGRLSLELDAAREDLEREAGEAALEHVEAGRVSAERDRLATVAEGYRVEARIAKGRAERYDADARRYLGRLELVTLERDQLREVRTQLRAECGRLLDRLEAAEAANPPHPNRTEVADFADERDRMIAANRDDHDGPWVPVLTGRIPTRGGGMGAVRVHDPDDPIARAFFLDDPDQHRAAAGAMVDDARARREAELAAHDREVADQAEHDVAEASWHHEMIDEVPPDEG